MSATDAGGNRGHDSPAGRPLVSGRGRPTVDPGSFARGPSVLSFEAVSFSYERERRVLEDVSWQVPPGRVALLGPNGAGKSTLLQIACGLLRPDIGTASLAGVPVGRRSRIGHRVGYLPQQVPTIRGLTVAEQVGYHLWLAGGSARDRTRVDAALELTNLGSMRAERSTALSGGETRRLGIACAVVHEPDVVLLDEPTAGLDPVERDSVEGVLRERITAQSLLVTTHQVEHLSEVYEHVAILRDGSLMVSADVDWHLAQDYATRGQEWQAIYRHFATGDAM